MNSELIAELESWARIREESWPGSDQAKVMLQAAAALRAQEEVIGWVDSWVSNPIGGYSVAALDGLFAMTRDKIAAITPPEPRDDT